MTLEINVYAYAGILVAWLVAEWFVVRYIKSQEREAGRQEMLGFVMVSIEHEDRLRLLENMNLAEESEPALWDMQ